MIGTEPRYKLNSFEVRQFRFGYVSSSLLVIKNPLPFAFDHLYDASSWVTKMQLYFLRDYQPGRKDSPIDLFFGAGFNDSVSKFCFDVSELDERGLKGIASEQEAPHAGFNCESIIEGLAPD